MFRFFFRFWFALCPIVLGTFEHAVIVADHHYENLIWGTVSGLGPFLMDKTFGLHLPPSWPGAFGFFIWPILAGIFLFWWSGELWQRSSVSHRRLYAMLLFLSTFCVVEVYRAMQPPFSWLPLYSNYFFAFT